VVNSDWPTAESSDGDDDAFDVPDEPSEDPIDDKPLMRPMITPLRPANL